MKMEYIVKRFYDELEKGKIMGRKCKECGAVEFPPVIACNTCGHFEMDWVEMSGNGVVTEIVMPSKMTPPGHDVFKPFGICCVKVEEGREINAIVRGIPDEVDDNFKSSLPLPVKARIFQLEKYKTVIFELDIQQ